MKKTFLSKRNAIISSANVSWGVFALALSVFALIVRLIAPNIFLYAFAPIFRGADIVTVESHRIFSSFGDTATLSLRNEQLANENAILSNENQTLLQKATSLEMLIGPSGSSRTAQSIIAGVIARPPTSPYDTLVLSHGSNDGVEIGMEVFGNGGVPLGVISSALADFSRATLFSSPNMTVDGWVGRSNLPLTIQGSGGGAMRASLARSAGVIVGDTVFVSGPGMLPVGTVVRIDSDLSSPTATLHIQPTLNLFSVAWVEMRDTGSTFTTSLSWATSTLP